MLLVAALLGFQLSRSVPALSATPLIPDTITPGLTPITLPWPIKGSAAVAIGGLGQIGAVKDEAPRPIASVTKIMTAYVVLKDHPLAVGDRGPKITVTAQDMATYIREEAQDQSVVKVVAGEQLSEYELLLGLMLASGNNFAEMLAVWDAGSVDAFVAKMNAEAASLGMKTTRYVDPSGFSAASTSTATDQVVLARSAMTNPVFVEIVRQPQATLPVAGVIYNVNSILGQDGIIGVKTGWTEEAGGCFVFAALWPTGGRFVEVYGAVLGQDTLVKAFDVSKKLVETAGPGVQTVRVLTRGQPAGRFSVAWGQKADAVLSDDIELLIWPGMTAQAVFDLRPGTAPLKKDAEVGAISLRLGEQNRRVSLSAATAITSPGVFWRVTRR